MKKNIPVDSVSKNNETQLQTAVRTRNIAVVSLVLECGAHIDYDNFEGRTP